MQTAVLYCICSHRLSSHWCKHLAVIVLKLYTMRQLHGADALENILVIFCTHRLQQRHGSIGFISSTYIAITDILHVMRKTSNILLAPDSTVALLVTGSSL